MSSERRNPWNFAVVQQGDQMDHLPDIVPRLATWNKANLVPVDQGAYILMRELKILPRSFTSSF